MKVNLKIVLVGIAAAFTLTQAQAMRWYSPSTAHWLSRDPIEEEGGENLYLFCGNDSVNNWDLFGEKWRVDRNGGAKASAQPEKGDTVADLAGLVGLSYAEYERWLTPSSGTAMPQFWGQPLTGCEHFEIPNTVVAYWAGWGGGFGRWYVTWNSSVKYLRARGFNVDNRFHKKGDKLALEKIFMAKSIAKELHGLYFWGHGYAPYPSTGLVSDSNDELLFYSSPGLYYHMALGLVFACDSNSGRTALMSGGAGEIWHGYTGTLYPVPFRAYHAKHFIKPGQQQTH